MSRFVTYQSQCVDVDALKEAAQKIEATLYGNTEAKSLALTARKGEAEIRITGERGKALTFGHGADYGASAAKGLAQDLMRETVIAQTKRIMEAQGFVAEGSTVNPKTGEVAIAWAKYA